MKEIMKYMMDINGKALNEMDVRMLNPLVLAYVGDTVYDLFVRVFLVSSNKVSVHQLNRMAISYVKAASQSDTLARIEGLLSEEEMTIVKRGRNAKSSTIPKNADVGQYRRATGFESLLGYLYLLGREDRLFEIMRHILKKEGCHYE